MALNRTFKLPAFHMPGVFDLMTDNGLIQDKLLCMRVNPCSGYDCELLHDYYGKFAYLLLKCYSDSLSEQIRYWRFDVFTVYICA